MEFMKQFMEFMEQFIKTKKHGLILRFTFIDSNDPKS